LTAQPVVSLTVFLCVRLFALLELSSCLFCLLLINLPEPILNDDLLSIGDRTTICASRLTSLEHFCVAEDGF
jgi:hypothetical protein